jgi:uncharacterized membrane-anchored protein
MRIPSLFAIGTLATLSLVGFSSASIAAQQEASAVESHLEAAVPQNMKAVASESVQDTTAQTPAVSNDVQSEAKLSKAVAGNANATGARGYIRARH